MDNLSTRLDLVFGALADPTRRAIVARLVEGEASVGELARPFDMALPSLMKHIRVLEAGGLVETEKCGRVRTCRLKNDATYAAERWLVEQRAVLESRLDRLEAYVATIEKWALKGSEPVQSPGPRPQARPARKGRDDRRQPNSAGRRQRT